MLVQVTSLLLSLSQVGSGYVKLDHVRSGYVNLVTLDQASSDYDRLVQVKLCYFRLG
jgi:hypothetical protein